MMNHFDFNGPANYDNPDVQVNLYFQLNSLENKSAIRIVRLPARPR
jgi:hypothetical protein